MTSDEPTPDQHRNRAQRRALQLKQGPRRTPFGGYPTPGVVRARGTSGRGHRATVFTPDNLRMRGPDNPETTDHAPPAV